MVTVDQAIIAKLKTHGQNFEILVDCNAALALKGGNAVTDTPGAVPSVTQMRLGNRANDTFLNGHLKKVFYYPQRLTNAELEAFSK